jgi:hypothetical protein
MRDLAGDRGIDAALDARPPAGGRPPHETSDQTKRRKLRQAAARTRRYLSKMRDLRS